MTDDSRLFHLLPTATRPHQPGIWDNGDGTFTIYPHLGPENVEHNRVSAEANDVPRFRVTPADKSVNRVAGIHFLSFGDLLSRNRYAASEILQGLEAAISLAKWLDCNEYGDGGQWPWAKEGQECCGG